MIENDNTNTNGDVDGLKNEKQQCPQLDVPNNNKWFIIVSPFLTKQAKKKLDIMQGKNAVNILCGSELKPVNIQERKAKKDDGKTKNYVELNGDLLTFEYKNLPICFTFKITRELGTGQIEDEELVDIIKKKVNEAINEGLFNEIFIEDDNIKYGKIIHEKNDFNIGRITRDREIDENLMVRYTYFLRCDYEKFRYVYNNDAKKDSGILLIGNNNSNSNKIYLPF